MSEPTWQRTDFFETDSFNEFGDIGIGKAWTAEYTRSDLGRKCAVTYGVTTHDFSDYSDTEPPDAYGVEEKTEVWTPEWDDYNQYDRGRDSADIDYDYGCVYSYETLEAAEKRALELASANLSFALV